MARRLYGKPFLEGVPAHLAVWTGLTGKWRMGDTMSLNQKTADSRPSLLVWLSLVVGVLLFLVLGLATWWAAERLDSKTATDERRAVAAQLTEEMVRLPQEQDSSVIWDDAVLNLRSDNQVWIAENLTEWLSTFYGHDRVYVVSPEGRVVRAAEGERRMGRALDRRDAGSVEPLIREFRATLSNASDNTEDSTAAITGMGILDTVRLGDGQLALVSIRPIVPDTEAVKQSSGTEFIHISVKVLSEEWLRSVAEIAGLNEIRSTSISERNGFLPLQNKGGRVIGFLDWSPHRPASSLLLETAPLTLSLIGAVLVGLGGTIFWLRRTSIQLQTSQARTNYFASHDSLTGAANRVLFEEKLREALAYKHLAKTKVALVSIDLDGFKEVNDALGHAAGDELIKQVVKRLSSTLPEEATLARFGGDEFALVQPGLVSEAHARWVFESLVQTFLDPFVLANGSVEVTASFGIALEEGASISPAELLRRADVALYVAKGAGRNRLEIYDPQMDRASREKRALTADLRSALVAGNELFVLYQPIYDAQSGMIAGAEALVRWDHPTRGHLAPDTFIGLAESGGLIDELGAWVLAKSCQYAAQQELPWVAVNVSPLQFKDPNFCVRVLDTLHACGLSPERLELEITEGLFLKSSPVVSTTLAKLQAAGVQIALDDFGTGYSSISYLRTLNVDTLKVDRSLIKLLGTDGPTYSIVRSLVQLAQALNISVTAEGIENDLQLRLARELGCTHVQGYLLSRPLTPDTLSALLTKLGSALN